MIGTKHSGKELKRRTRRAGLVVCCAAMVLAGCSAATAVPDAPRRWSVLVNEGPVRVEARVLVDLEEQRAATGHATPVALFTQLVPIELSLENVGSRPRMVRTSNIKLSLFGGQELTPLPPERVAATLRDAYEDLRHYEPPIEYTIAKAALNTSSVFCVEPNLLCGVPFGLAFASAFGDSARMATERARFALELRRMKKSLAELLASIDAEPTDITLDAGQRTRTVVYFPIAVGRLHQADAAALLVRFVDTAGAVSPIVVRVWLRQDAASAGVR